MPTLYLTGSSGALARVIRQYYLDKGWSVAGFDAFDDEFRGENFDFYIIDSTKESSVTEAFSKASAKFGAPDALIATIGGLKPWANIEDVSLEDFRFVV